MPDHCCVPNSNYAGTENYVSVYKFPMDEANKQLWGCKIPRANFTPSKRSVVCEKHFREDMIVREDVYTDKNGVISRIPRKRPMLKDGAYPCIFNGCLMYMTEKPPAVRRSRMEKEEYSHVSQKMTKLMDLINC
ncbi:52 kDa repressor of the inhibitor of the protein kinase-like [Stegodyphus dumicola]|uniref:52 kDa repressor of the inhibitor of the protein kinase-like n=1 Tax=Stegodyphus dumicola TaxID=202533 RepID=UPI0015AD25F5|nr:52 kDa repressor of the inhibitor of the protein kinase-like [Stegodyphus dumicola]